MEKKLNALHLHVENMVSKKGLLVNDQDVKILISFTFEQLHAFSHIFVSYANIGYDITNTKNAMNIHIKQQMVSNVIELQD